jgi:hypothetical protein
MSTDIVERSTTSKMKEEPTSSFTVTAIAVRALTTLELQPHQPEEGDGDKPGHTGTL